MLNSLTKKELWIKSLNVTLSGFHSPNQNLNTFQKQTQSNAPRKPSINHIYKSNPRINAPKKPPIDQPTPIMLQKNQPCGITSLSTT